MTVTGGRVLPGLWHGVLAVALLATLAISNTLAAERPDYTPDEIQRILAHGPWPVEWAGDPSNRVSGTPAAIALGERLFFDARLSGPGTVSCATCHDAARGWSDGRARSEGLATVDRNAPGLLDVRLHRWFGWDGAGDNLWAQSLRPILDAREMGGDAAHAAALVREDPALACRWRAAFGAPPSDDATRTLVDLAKSLAAYQETLASGRTPFDDFRDALVSGDAAAAARYPAAAARGLKLFVGKGGCAMCHVGPAFTNGEFHDVGIPFFIAPGRVDPGRHEGVKKLRENPFSLLGPHSDDPGRTTATGTRHVTLEHRNFGEFKVPSLRNVARTAPYMHNGRLATLSDVVRHYSTVDEDRLHGDGERLVRALNLDDREIDDLVAFLESLTDDPATRPKPPAATLDCP